MDGQPIQHRAGHQAAREHTVEAREHERGDEHVGVAARGHGKDKRVEEPRGEAHGNDACRVALWWRRRCR